MQVQIKYVGGSESVWWDGGKELLIDLAVVHRPDGRWGGSGQTRCQEHAHPRPCGREWNIQTIVERTTGSRLRMPRLLIGWLPQTHTHGRQVQEVIVLPAHNDPRPTSGKEIGQRSGIAIQSVQTSQDVGERKRKRAGIAADHRSGSPQFPPVIPIAGVAERAQPLVRMRLQNRRSRAGDFSPFASQVCGSRDQLKAAMGREARSAVWGSARCLTACFVPSTSTTVQWLPRRSHSPPGGEANADRATRSRLERACAAPPPVLDQGPRESGKASQDAAGLLSQTVP